MSTTETDRLTGTDRRPIPAPSDCPTEVLPLVPVRRSILRAPAASAPAPATIAQAERSPFADWRDAAPTELLPATPAPTELRRERDRVAARRLSHRRHLRSALTGVLIAAALLTGLQLYAAAGISSARQAALASSQRDAVQAPASAVPVSGQSTHSGQGAPSPMSGQSPAQPDWVTEDTDAPYDRTNPHASPLTDLPRCTTAPDTAMPCLAWNSADSTRAVVLEEDASLTALVRR